MQEDAEGAGAGRAQPEVPAPPPWAAEGDLRPDVAREAVRREEGLFRGVFDTAAVGLAILDLEGRFIDANPALQDMLGYVGEELRRMDFSGFVHPKDMPAARTLLDDLGRGRARQARMVLRYIRKGWEMRWGRVTGSLMCGPRDGQPLIVAALENITEQVLTAQSLRASFAMYRDLVDNAAAGVATADSDGNLTFVNTALCALSGYSEEELLGRHFSEFLPPEDLADMLDRFGAVFSDRREGLALEFRLVRKDGRVVHCFTSPTVSRLGGEASGFSAIIQDISARKRAEEELERLAAIVRHSRELVALTTPSGRIVFLNDAGMRMLGLSAEDPGGADMMGVFPPEQRLKVEREVLPGVVANGSWVGELAYRNVKDGSERAVQSTLFPVFGRRAGAPQYIAHISLDITGRKRTETELVRLSAAVRLVGESVLIMDTAGRVEFANAAARGLVAGCALPGGGWDFAGCLPPSGREKWRLVLAETLRRGSVRGVELDLEAGGGRHIPIEVSATAMGGDGGSPAGVVAILRDISERKHAQRQMRARLMAFELEEGNVYLVKESAPILALAGFLDLLRAGYRGTALSRTPPRGFAPEAAGEFGRLWLSEKAAPDSISPGAERLIAWAEALPRNHAILLDRLDYLISRTGFKETLGLVHRLREISFLMGHIVIIGLDPATLDGRRLRAFEKETCEMAPRERLRIPPELLEIIRYVYEQGITGARPTLTGVGQALGLSKPTARKRSRDAARGGYIALSPKGRTKTLELTEKGRGVFSK